MRGRAGPQRAGAAPYQDPDAFARLTSPYRTELLAHCYRMLGSVHDAEDLVQETYLRAWRGFAGFEGRSSVRVWLHRIATSACLTALEHSSRRFVPSGLGPPGDDPRAPLTTAGAEVSWVQPLPDGLYGAAAAPDPAAVVARRGSVRLALIVALQQLPPRQRAVLVLRDVLAWRAAEVAELLGTTPAAVNSALQRARAHLARTAPDEDDVADAPAPGHRVLLARYARALEDADVEGLMGLLREEARLEMPPELTWFSGRERVAGFLGARVLTTAGALRTTPTSAGGGQPALAVHRRAADGTGHANCLQVLEVRGGLLAGITVFRDTSLFALFGLPLTLPAH
jgi:RNA polymerase sigma-70 factor (ECF subfamily)